MRSQRTITRECIACGQSFDAPFRYSRPRRYCSARCANWSHYRTTHWAERFWSKVDRSGDCWLWIGKNKHANGYGLITVEGERWYAHRLSWVMANGPIPDGLHVLHNCPTGDNPACVNPAHLFLGTQGDNVQDMWAKGRRNAAGFSDGHLTKWLKEHPEGRPRGERHGQAKLTEAQVAAIREAYRPYKVTMRELGARFGVSETAVFQVVHERTWR